MKATSTERVQAFLDELTELSRRTGVSVSGCGCCDSPRVLVDGGPWDWVADGWYIVDHNPQADPDANQHIFAQLRWRPSAEKAAFYKDRRPGLDHAPSVLPVAESSAQR